MTTITSPRPNRRHRRHSVAILPVLALAALAGRAQASMHGFNVPLTGSEEVPSNTSTGLGVISGSYDDVTNSLGFTLNFTGLLGGLTTQAHLHSPAPAGVNAPVQIGFAGFPTNVTGGSYSNSYIFIVAQEADLLAGLMYVNVHTNLIPGGEIRGQIFPAVPEPGIEPGMLSVLGLAGLAALARRSRSS